MLAGLAWEWFLLGVGVLVLVAQLARWQMGTAAPRSDKMLGNEVLGPSHPGGAAYQVAVTRA